MEILTDPEVWLAFLTLTVLEIVLGIDNIIFISVLTGRLPEAQRARGRSSGSRSRWSCGLRCCVADVGDEADGRPVHRCSARAISGRDLILLLGGAFLIAKSTQEVHNSLEGIGEEGHGRRWHRDVRQRAACRSV